MNFVRRMVRNLKRNIYLLGKSVLEMFDDKILLQRKRITNSNI